MKLASIELFRYSLPLARPLTLSRTTLYRREGVLVRLTGDDGAEGWGEASPLPGFSGESLEDAVGDLRGSRESLVGRELVSDGEFGPELDPMNLSPSARFGIELAVRNMLPVACQLADTVHLSGLLAGSEDEILEDARRMRDSGYRSAKLKVGRGSVKEDAGLVHSVSEVLGEQTSLRLDANRAWSLEEAGKFARIVEYMSFEYVEEPLADPALLPRLTRETGIPVALDESLVGMEPEALGEHGYARAIVLKPTLLGGISRTMGLATRARELGITPVMSSAYESGIGTLGLVSLAASLNCEVPAGLDTYRRLAEDILVPPLDLGGPGIDVREMLGLQRELKWESLSRLE